MENLIFSSSTFPNSVGLPLHSSLSWPAQEVEIHKNDVQTLTNLHIFLVPKLNPSWVPFSLNVINYLIHIIRKKQKLGNRQAPIPLEQPWMLALAPNKVHLSTYMWYTILWCDFLVERNQGWPTLMTQNWCSTKTVLILFLNFHYD